ncbi:MAG: WYL domain-containing protein [Xanthomonadales bacterium]|nr:WYL domain-containing protein [Xanthomonadales bacterium]
MTGSFYRGQMVVQMIPHEPQGITTREIHQRLRERYEIDTSIKTVQRDLADIRLMHPLESTEEPTPRHYWPRHAQVELVPGHDDYSALTWGLLEDYLEPLIPASMASQARPVFDTARRYLESGDRSKVREWRRRVRMIPRAMALRPPDIDPAVQQEAYEALWDSEQLKVQYFSRSSGRDRELILHPQALVVREGVFYLVAQVDGYDDVRHFALHRMTAVSNQYRPATRAADFDLDDYIARGGFAYVESGEVDLVLRFDSYVGQHLLETPLSENQTSSTLADDRIEIRASVLDSQQLRWWVLGFGSAVEVVEPVALREWVAAEVKQMATHYRVDTD